MEEDGARLQVAHVTVTPNIACEASHQFIDITKSLCADDDGVGPCYVSTIIHELFVSNCINWRKYQYCEKVASN